MAEDACEEEAAGVGVAGTGCGTGAGVSTGCALLEPASGGEEDVSDEELETSADELLLAGCAGGTITGFDPSTCLDSTYIENTTTRKAEEMNFFIAGTSIGRRTLRKNEGASRPGAAVCLQRRCPCATLVAMRFLLRMSLSAGLLCMLPVICSAAALPVTLANSQNDLLQRIAQSPAHALVSLTGNGDRIEVRYGSTSPVDALIFFSDGKQQLDITTALSATLPAGNDEDMTLDVSRSPAWSAFSNDYQIYFLAKDAGTRIQNVSLIPVPFWRFPLIGVSQLFSPEPYQPSSYHRLKGYAVFGIPLPVLALVITVVCLIVLWIPRRWRSQKNRMTVCVLLIVFLLYGARFSIDLLRMTASELTQWETHHMYEQAGSAYAIADALKQDSQAHFGTGTPSVLLCNEGNSFIPALMAEQLFPLGVVTQTENEQTPDYVIAFQPAVPSTPSGAHVENVRCGDATISGLTRLQSFPDGSILYAMR